MTTESERVLFDLGLMDESLVVLEANDEARATETARHKKAQKELAEQQAAAAEALIGATPDDCRMEAMDIAEEIDDKAYALRQQLKALSDEATARYAVLAATYTPADATGDQATRVVEAVKALASAFTAAHRRERAIARRAS